MDTPLHQLHDQRHVIGKVSRGFTLIELLAVVAVISVLVALILPAVQQARERARAVQCLQNLKQLGIALQSYESTHTVWPPSFLRQIDGEPAPPSVPFATLRYRGHWTGYHMLLPYLDQQNLYSRYDFRGTWLSPLTDANDHTVWPLNQTSLGVLICPSAIHASRSIGGDQGGGLHWMAGSPTDYSFNHGMDIIRALPGDDVGCSTGLLHFWRQTPERTRGPFGYNSDCRPQHVRDGVSNTIVLGEKAGGRLTYGGSDPTFPVLPFEYPWAMAAVEYIAPTGDATVPGSAWVGGPLAVTHDFRLPMCPESPPGTGSPYPMNPVPRILPHSTDERPFYSFQSMHTGGAHFLMGDGSARLLNESLNQGVYQALSTIAGGEVISSGSY